MPPSVTTSALYVVDREPRPSRHLIPPGTPRRGEVVAALTLRWIAAHLLLAQLTLLLAVAFGLIGRATRWRPAWLAVPAAAGLVWVLAIGPRAALAGFTAGPRQVLGYLAGDGRLTRPGCATWSRGYAGLAGWLPRQAPLALLAAAAEAAAAWWLRWLHRGDGASAPPRPGLAALARRQFTVWSVQKGGVVGRAGVVLGVDWPSGRPAEVPWRAAERGVLVAGGAARDGGLPVRARGHPAAQAGARGRPGRATRAWPRRWPPSARKPARRCTCSATARPGLLRPAARRRPGPERGPGAGHGRLGRGRQARPGAPAPATCTTCSRCWPPRPAIRGSRCWTRSIHLLSPDALWARLRQVPPDHPRRAPAGRAGQDRRPSLLTADPATGAFLASELAGLRAAPLGRWLRPAAAAGEDQISLAAAVRDRAVVLFSLHQRAARAAPRR